MQTIVTDCLGIKKKCVTIQRGQYPKETVLKGANADVGSLAGAPQGARVDFQVAA